MKFLMLMADGYEDTEATATADVLMRGGQTVVRASLMNGKEILSKCGVRSLADCMVAEAEKEDFDGLIIPGGPGSFKIMPGIPAVERLIRKYADAGKLVASICAAPHLVGKLGYFKNKYYTVHPGFENYIVGGKYLREKGVVTDGNFITAKSMYYSVDFGLEIIAYYYGRDYAEKLRGSCMGE